MASESGVDAAQLRIQGELVNVLERCETLRSDGNRQVLAGLLSDLFGEAVFLQGQAARMQLLDLVRQCCKQPSGLTALVAGVTALEPQAPEVDELVHLSDEWAAVRALPTRDWDKLRQALRSVRLTDDPAAERRLLRHLARVATDGKCDDLPAQCRSAWSVFLHLADLNAGPDALPPAMVFIACLSDQVEDKALAEEFLRWNWRWAERFEVTDLVERARWREKSPREGEGAEIVYLVFEVDPDPAEQDKVVLSHWRQWDAPGWNAQRRGDVAVRRDELESEIDQVVAALEVDLGVRPEGLRVGAIVLEFMLPWEMLNTPVQYWRKATMSTDAVPLAVDHPVVLRSLERMRNQRFLLAWKKRWSAVAGRSASTSPYWGQANGAWDPTRMAVDLGADDSIVSLVLSEPPGDRGGRAWHEAAMAFRAGIPVILWDREDCTTTGFHDAVTALFADGAIDQLPHRVARLRREALRSNASNLTHAGHGIAVLWDDADRLPEPLGAWWGSLGGSE